MCTNRFFSRTSQISRFAVASLAVCQLFLVRPVQAQRVLARIDGPAVVNGTTQFNVEYTIINNTPGVVDGILTATVNGALALATPDGTLSLRPYGWPQFVHFPTGSIPKGQTLNGTIDVVIPGNGTYQTTLSFCSNSRYPVWRPVTLTPTGRVVPWRTTSSPTQTVLIMSYDCTYTAYAALDIVATGIR
jgi:hypothetical protein